jgi:hypothetical protein
LVRHALSQVRRCLVGAAPVIAIEILAAIVLAKWGGDLASSRAYDGAAEKLVGWAFILAAIAVAYHTGARA